MRTLGVIPARGGSKRLPRKNIRLLRGKPLIAWTIEAAAKAASLTDWLVSTDDEEIARIAVAWGAPVPFLRPLELGGDDIRNSAVLGHALVFMERRTGRRYDAIVLLQPTCPIRKARHIDEAVALLAASELDTLASVKALPAKRDPNLRAVRDGVLVPFGADEPAYLYNAAIYAMKRDWFLRHEAFVSDRSVPLVMDRWHSLDIDEEIDLKVAELYMQEMERGRTADAA